MRGTLKKALIVDDSGDVRATVAMGLAAAGWETVEGEDGEEGIAAAVRECPDLIFLDLVMPGKDGFEVLGELRHDARTSHIPVVVLTAINDYQLGDNYDAESMGQGLDVSPPEGFIEKPFDIEEVLDAAAEAMGAVEFGIEN